VLDTFSTLPQLGHDIALKKVKLQGLSKIHQHASVEYLNKSRINSILALLEHDFALKIV